MSALTGLTIAAQDSATMVGREFKHTLRFPLLIASAILVPVVFFVAVRLYPRRTDRTRAR